MAVDDQGNALAVFAVIQFPNDLHRMRDRAMYTTPSRRRQNLATKLFLRARADFASAEPLVSLEWSGVATTGGYQLAKRFGFSISDERSAELGAKLDELLAENPEDEVLRLYDAVRDEHGGRLPFNPLRQEKADQEGREALRDAAQVLQLQVIEEE
ncbi:hypothetical protein ACIO52_04640 [Nocardia sp. NPDC087230]|uniref:hypothetical protein n=1 Tax=Nocardia sp. NPDC087230 TaxID=3364331 RepID=UPI00382FE9D1